mmetsp:Transcript_11445/g.24460  ORF Transcript_11445/g.24460 Transcript_11445/m.24460 type:complete len:1108 (+) Transcript_11445:113-3436(+)
MAVSFATAPPAASTPSSSTTEPPPKTTVPAIILSHVDAFQRNHAADAPNSKASSAHRAAAAIRDEISQLALASSLEGLSVHDENNDHRDDTEEERAEMIQTQIANTLLRCMDSAMLTIFNSASKTSWADSISSIFHLVASLACSCKNDEEGVICKAVIDRAIQYSLVEKDVIRAESCELLGMCIGHLAEGSKAAVSILKGKKSGGKVKKAVVSSPPSDSKKVKESLVEWKLECILSAGYAIHPRLTDKSVKVRTAAISAASCMFAPTRCEHYNASEDFVELTNTMASTVLWLLSNDSSASNRALAASGCAVTADSIPYIIQQIRDQDVKVREAALDALREKSNVESLTEDQKVEILKSGLTKRCPSTHAKTVELLCCSWMKHSKFDPISFLRTLNPVLNESVAESAARVIINVASTLDCESSCDMGVELVRKQFGAPEIRSFQECVLKKMTIVPEVEEDSKAEAGDEDEDLLDGGEKIGSVDPVKALFLRVKCALATESTTMSSVVKADTISDIISDIPTLCNLLNKHLDKLIEFNNGSTDNDDLDDDEAGAFEDDQNFICLQLIHMAESSELEEGSRRHFISIMRSMLSRLATPDDLVETCVKAMAAAHDTEAQFLQTISEILVDVEDDETFNHSSNNGLLIVRQMRAISILSIVLENISGHMMTNPILEGFRRHLEPAITSKNPIVRQHGVGCWSKFALLCDQDTVLERDMPLLLQIASQEEEIVDVRAQAALALCDLVLIHDKIHASDDDSATSHFDSFKKLLLEMLEHSKPAIVIIAAEITAKLLLAGSFHDPHLLACLFVIYFDTSLIETEEDDDNDENAVTEVGNPVRLRQLLTIFFPTYSMSSLEANDTMMASVAPTISIVNRKLDGKNSPKAMSQWPIAKMIEYICCTVDLADKKKVEGDDDETNGISSEQPMETHENEPAENDNTASDDKTTSIEASSTLLASIDIAEFLMDDSQNAPPLFVRALAKILSSASIDVDNEDLSLLSRLKSHVAEAEYSINDRPALAALEKVSCLLEAVEDECEGESDDERDDESDEEEDEICDDILVDAMKRASLKVGPEVEKENVRLSAGSMCSTATKQSEGGTRRSTRRARLADINN